MKKLRQNKSISAVAALVLFAVFAVSLLATLLAGSGVYRSITERDTLSYQNRTAASYVATRLRQVSSPQDLNVGAFGNSDALILTETVDGTEYVTKVYCCDGWLMELFSAADNSLDPEDGEKILPVEKFEISRREGMLSLSLTDSGGETVLLISPRGEEAAYAK